MVTLIRRRKIVHATVVNENITGLPGTQAKYLCRLDSYGKDGDETREIVLVTYPCYTLGCYD